MVAAQDARLSDAVREFLAVDAQRPFVGGGRRDSDGELIDDVNPATGSVLTAVVRAKEADAEGAVAAARAAFPRWARTSPAERSTLLLRLAESVERDRENLAQLETLDTGKPITEARGDIARALDGLRFYAGCARQIRGETISVDERFAVWTLRRPLGVVAAIVPWNVPFVLTICKAAPALAAGNAVIVKPAEATPLTALRLAELAAEAGLPAGVLNVLTGSGRVIGAFLAAHPAVDKVTFTGSTETGISIAQAAAPTVKSVSLELGGKSPNIVFADADLAAAGAAAAAAIFYGQGEICTAGSRLFVQREIYDELLERAVAHARSLRVGDPLDEETDLGSLISEEHLQSVLAAVERAVEEGASVVTGGRRIEDGELALGAFMDATIVGPTRPEMFVEQEEIFGPVLAVAPFDSEDEVVARANASRYGLAAAVWTRDSRRARRMVEALESGVVWVNSYNDFDAAVPFGGVKLSGNAREWSHVAVEAFTQLKSVWERV